MTNLFNAYIKTADEILKRIKRLEQAKLSEGQKNINSAIESLYNEYFRLLHSAGFVKDCFDRERKKC